MQCLCVCAFSTHLRYKQTESLNNVLNSRVVQRTSKFQTIKEVMNLGHGNIVQKNSNLCIMADHSNRYVLILDLFGKPSNFYPRMYGNHAAY